MITVWRVVIAALMLGFWHIGAQTGLLSPLFFGHPVKIFAVIGDWFVTGEIWRHLAITLIETLLAFATGTILGVGTGLWLGLSPAKWRSGARWCSSLCSSTCCKGCARCRRRC